MEKEFRYISLRIRGELADRIEEWMDGDGEYEPLQWEDFLEMALEVLPPIAKAYAVYCEAWETTPVVARSEEPQTFEGFVHSSVSEWFR